MRKVKHISLETLNKKMCPLPQRRTLKDVINLLESVVEKSAREEVKEVDENNTQPSTGNISASDTENKTQENFITYTVLWGKKSTKKHKTWEGDGTLEVSDGFLRLLDENAKVLGVSSKTGLNIACGSRICIGNKEVEIIDLKLKSCESALVVKGNTTINEFTNKMKSMNKTFRGGLYSKPLLFPKPALEHQWHHNQGKTLVRDVILDSILNNCLRPHQRDGLIFLYECVLGFRNPGYYGAILADEMGLGKTLQCVALIWTLLKQGPYGSSVCKNILITTPSSLCDNWKKEFVKWLGRERLLTYVVGSSNKAVDYKKLPLVPVMIISYEQFVRSFSDIQQIDFDLIVCDEGHRLKNASVKAAQLLYKMKCKRRILLTGTPVQNDLEEYFSVVNVVNPGFLGTYSEFRKDYELPILAAQQPNCSEEAKKEGEEKSAQLHQAISRFLLRRTQEIMTKYLPTKVELLLFCKLTESQQNLYNQVIGEWVSGGDTNPFAIISKLRKICSHPSLLADNKKVNTAELTENSGKMKIVESIIRDAMKKMENLVLVSYFTQYLDLLEMLCHKSGARYLRLDGSTPTSQRKNLVDSFNKKTVDVFLLSARAGGTGLNLVGGTKLVLTDGDWNPSNDLQAIARIWRDGQKKEIKIYRLINTGTIEEKIFQRQLSKLGLSDCVENPENIKSVLKFSQEELRDLFQPNFTTPSMTHDLLECSCTEVNEITQNKSFVSKSIVDSCVNQLKDWKHWGPPLYKELLKDIGLSSEYITFIFQKITN